MTEDDLTKLCHRDSVPLAGLESDLWVRERVLLASKMSGRRIASWQTAIMTLAVLASASFGVVAAAAHREGGALTYTDLAPASLILGAGE